MEATRRWAGEDITANALMPGGIMTNLQRRVSLETREGWVEMERSGRITMKTPQQGAATTLVAAVSPELEGVGGRYVEDCNEANVVADNAEVSRGLRRWAVEPEAAARLWEVSLEMLERPLPRAT